MSSSSSERQGRGIGSIAHFFLSQNNADGVPSRRAPQREAETVTEISPDNRESSGVTDMESFHTNLIEQIAGSGGVLLGEVLLADHLADHQEKVSRYIQYLSSQEERVGLVEIDHCEARLSERRSDRKNEDVRQAVIAETEDINGSLIPALNKLAESHDILLLDLAESFREHGEELVKNCTWVTVLCTCCEADIVETYKAIKWLVEKAQWRDKISLFVCDVPDKSADKTASRVFDKLAETTRNFLNVEMQLIGYCLAGERVASDTVEANDTFEEFGDETVDEVGDETVNEVVNEVDNETCNESNIMMDEMNKQQTIGTVCDELTSDPVGTPVLDKRPTCGREDVFSEFDDTDAEIGTDAERGQVSLERSAVYSAICVDELPCDDRRLGDVLQLALPGWLGEIPSATIVPLDLPDEIDPAVKILIDAEGRLHVMLAVVSSDDGIISRALAARKWLRANSELVSGCCRQLRINRKLQVGLVLIAESRIDSLETICSQITDFPCLIMQLHYLRNDGKWSLLPMPVSQGRGEIYTHRV